jgi:hypothetical protein
MSRKEFDMPDSEYEFVKHPLPERGVERVVYMTTALVKAARGHNEDYENTFREVARQCRIGASVVERFFFPSRRPKSIDADLLDLIRGAYLR